jgi:hypothetical protein
MSLMLGYIKNSYFLLGLQETFMLIYTFAFGAAGAISRGEVRLVMGNTLSLIWNMLSSLLAWHKDLYLLSKHIYDMP